MSNLQFIKEKVIEACNLKATTKFPTSVGIAEILRTIRNNETSPIGIDINGNFLDCDIADNLIILKQKWDLSHDDLEKQSPETINFLAKVLGKN